MSRYTGPKSRVSRRLGTNIWGTAGRTAPSSAVPTRRVSTAAAGAATPPSTWSSSRRSRRPASPTAQRAAVPQPLREASRKRGVTGEIMLQLLERRLDNIVYRAGWASTGLRPASS